MKRIRLATWLVVAGVALAATAANYASGPRTPDSTDVSQSNAAGGARNFGFGSFHHRNQFTPCMSVARAARTACLYDARDDYYTQFGSCTNLSDRDDRDECRDEAGETKYEDMVLCYERLEARTELCEELDEERYDPDLDPDDFLSAAEIAASPNPWFPLVPGNTWIYENPADDEEITVVVTGDTIEIEGIECVIVNDVVTEDGEVIEDTDDYYAQDLDGNLWYMGEIAKNYEDGRLTDLDGSWRHGEDYGLAGILFHAVPVPGTVYRQEFLLREAEDAGKVISITANETSDFINCSNDCLQTLDFTPLEPDALEHKFFYYGVGLILETDAETGERGPELVDFFNDPVN